MADHLLDIREAAEYLGVGERIVKELVDTGKLPAYRIGGAFLRFRKSQLAIAKTALCEKTKNNTHRQITTEAKNERAEAIKDFLYFNDFYILSVIVIVIAIVLIIAT
ncbi:helix-turn-helix domain-containing protein [Omnitrophica bacterium]|nr:helix-turn-helix domain-containing protein [Candidatus Omnitrophota bacterium]